MGKLPHEEDPRETPLDARRQTDWKDPETDRETLEGQLRKGTA
jgi:hypothetical protein